MSVELASLALKIDAREVDPATLKLAGLTEAGGKAEGAVERLSTASSRLAEETRKAMGVTGGAASSLREMADAVNAQVAAETKAATGARTLAQAQGVLAAETRKATLSFADFFNQNDFAQEYQRATGAALAHGAALGKVGGAAKLTTNEMLNLTRQLSDVGVTAALGMSPLMILIQQGPQIADVFQSAAARGLGFSAVLKEIGVSAWTAIAPFAPFIAVAAATAAVLGGGLAVATQQVNAHHKDLAKTLGLTADQLEHVKNKGVTMGDVLKGTFKTASDALMKAFGPELKTFETAMGKAYQGAVDGAVKAIKAIVGGFIGGYEAIKATWALLPAALGDAAFSAANAVLGGLERLAGATVDAINRLVRGANAAAAAAGLSIRLPEIDKPALARFTNQYAGALEKAGDAAGKAFQAGMAKGASTVDGVFAAITKNTLAAAEKRIRAEAGKARPGGGDGKGSSAKDIEDQTNAFAEFEKAMKAARAEAEAFARFKPKKIGDIAGLIGARDAREASDELSRYADRIDQIASHAQDAGQAMSQAFGGVGGVLGGLLTSLSTYDARLADLAARRAAAEANYQTVRSAANASEEAIHRADLDRQNTGILVAREAAQAQIQHYGDIAGAAKGFFKEGSRGYKALEIAEQAYRAIQFAMSVKALLMKGAETTATVAGAAVETASVVGAETAKTAAALTGAAVRTPAKVAEGAASMFAALGPLGFPAVAAMIAIMAGLGFAGSGGGSIPGAQDAENRQKAQGTGSVLGDASAKSDSIARSLDVLAKNSYSDLQFSNQMLRSLRSIDNQIGTVASALARSLGVGGALSTDGLGLGSSTSGPGALTRILAPISNLLPGLFGSKTTRTLQDQGLSFTSQNLAQLLSGGVQGQTYQQVLENTKKSFFGVTYSNKNKVSTTTGALDPDFAKQVTLLIGSLRDTVLQGAKTLGADGAQAALDAFTVDLGKLSFKDLKGDEIEAALKAVFSKLGDDLASAAVPQLAELQKVGEGALETLARVVHDYTTLDASLASIGKTFGAVGVASLTAREHLVDLVGSIDDLVDKTNAFAENFLTDAERMAPVAKAVTAELSRLGLTGITTKEAFKNLVLGLDLTTTAGQEMYAALLALAPAFAKVVDFNVQGSQAVQDARSALSRAYERESGAIQDTIDKFDAFAQSLKKFRGQLDTGPAAQLSPEEQYRATKAAFENTSAKAKAGDAQAIGDLQNVSQAYLDASKAYYATSAGYFADLAAVKDAVSATQVVAQGQADTARAQLNALNEMVAGILGTKDAVLSVHDALLAYQAVVAAQQTALTPVTTPTTTPATNDNNPTTPTTRAPDWASYLSHYADVAAEYERNLASSKGKAYLKSLGIGSATDFAQWHYAKYGQAEGRTPYKAGGIIDRPMTVGESGIAGEAGPEAIVPLVRTPQGLGVRSGGDTTALERKFDTLIAETRALRAELKADKTQRAGIHADTAERLDRLIEGTDQVRKAARIGKAA